MKIKSVTTMAVTGLMVAGLTLCGFTSQVSAAETYAGKIEFQDQTITKATAAALHREMALQRASQLVLWAMPAISFYQLHDAIKTDLNLKNDDPVIGLFEGYDGV